MESSLPGRFYNAGVKWAQLRPQKKRSSTAPFLIQAKHAEASTTTLYLFLFAIISWMIGARISSMAKPILAPGTTRVLRRDMKEFGIMFSR